MVTLIILALFILVSMIRDHQRVLYTLLWMVIGGTFLLVGISYYYEQLNLSPLVWMFLQSLGVYIAFLSFQTLFFERFVACFNIKGNVGFFIVSIDFIGYLGTVGVLVFKEAFVAHLNWIEFYNTMVLTLGTACCFLFMGCILYSMHRSRAVRKEEIPSVTTALSLN